MFCILAVPRCRQNHGILFLSMRRRRPRNLSSANLEGCREKHQIRCRPALEILVSRTSRRSSKSILQLTNLTPAAKTICHL